jgi:cytochrome c oxidase cbb3-type subunit II
MSREPLFKRLDKSAVLTVIGVILLFSGSIFVTLIAPRYVDPSWTTPSSNYQVQMYTLSDPNVFISTTRSGSDDIQLVYRLEKGTTLTAFQESELVRIAAPPELEQYVTRFGDELLKLTGRVLFLREASSSNRTIAAKRQELQRQWQEAHPEWNGDRSQLPSFSLFELYDPELTEGFAIANTDGIIEDWVDAPHFTIMDYPVSHDTSKGTIFVGNPMEYRVRSFIDGRTHGLRFDPDGERVGSIEELKNSSMGFLSRRELIRLGESIYKGEGCFNCHTDQSRTLVEDCVLNGSERFPAPPSTANEYIFQEVTMPGTRRIGPDLSRVAIKRPSRDWHLAHFWSPKTKSPGSIMPSFRHFFDHDPRGSGRNPYDVPNWRFEAVFQYLMTKGSRITPPTQAWWLGRDPVNVLNILDGDDGNASGS